MLEFNARTSMDFVEHYDPELMDREYLDKANALYNKHYTKMPNEIDFTFDHRYSGVRIEGEDLEDIRSAYHKFNADGDQDIL